MDLKKAESKVRKLWRWIIGDQDIIVEISEAFTIITVINSYMMISGMDKPKIGQFAYVHLLIRLAIITVVLAIWEDESLFQAIKSRIVKLKNLNKINIKEIYKNVLKNKFGSICTIFMLTTVIICLVMIFGVNTPKGGAELYYNLILLFVFISIIVLFVYLLETIKGFSEQKSTK